MAGGGKPKSHSASEASYRRGEIWMVDFGNPLGTELGMEHPAVIVSRQELNNFAARLGRVIVVPGTSAHFTNSSGTTLFSHREVGDSISNGLHHSTYFMTEQVRSVSIIRLRRLVGVLEASHVRAIDDRLCLVLDLFQV
ncbi:MAG: type II toxin-antitoxin system PemK/MazF family toxin [Candidatus Obscuribacterales bacterium]|nr:type II toxin-antitoxin system PemK/MazF family toxin [Candidatus Obscuribacterales bacterium]